MYMSSEKTIPVILDHDGGVDDFIALILLASATATPETFLTSSPKLAVPKIKLIGVTIVEADTFAEPCMDVCRRALALYAESDPLKNTELGAIPVAASNLKGTAAPFPTDWRKDAFILADLPVLNTTGVNGFLKNVVHYSGVDVSPHEHKSSKVVEKDHHDDDEEKNNTGATLWGKRNGHQVLADLVLKSPDPVTLVVTGPMTNVAHALRTHGSAFAKNIGRILLMGGAAKVQGNVFNKNLPEDYPCQVNGDAEWNIFWDAKAAADVFECPELSKKIVMFGLDATNSVPVTSQFVRRFGNECLLEVTMSVNNGSSSSSKNEEDQKNKSTMLFPSKLSQFVGGAWSNVTFVNRGWGGACYFAWDALTAAYLIDPSVATQIVPAKVTIEATSGHPSEGRTICDFDANENEKNVHVVMSVDAQRFYQIAVDCAKMI